MVLLSSAAFASAKVPDLRVDQTNYLKALRERRPDLVKETCAQNLIAKSKYRERILKGENLDEIRDRELTPETKVKLEQWADQFRSLFKRMNRDYDKKMRALEIDPADETDERLEPARSALEFYPTDFPNDHFVAFHMGPAGPFYDASGIAYKASFEFGDAVTDVSADRFLLFVRGLAGSGYKGTVRLIFRPSAARFHFNNIVAHGRTKEDVMIAERTAKALFGGRLVSLSRGLDVKVETESSRETYDWNRFLCEQDVSSLPQPALDFVQFKKAKPQTTHKSPQAPKRDPFARG